MSLDDVYGGLMGPGILSVDIYTTLENMVKVCSYPSVGILSSPHSTFHLILAVFYGGLMRSEYISAVLSTALREN